LVDKTTQPDQSTNRTKDNIPIHLLLQSQKKPTRGYRAFIFKRNDAAHSLFFNSRFYYKENQPYSKLSLTKKKKKIGATIFFSVIRFGGNSPNVDYPLPTNIDLP
jgi:hypothetical protein